MFSSLFNFFPKVPVYVKLYANAIEFTNLDTNETITAKSHKNFSSSRVLLADWNTAAELMMSTLSEMKLGKRSTEMLIQSMENYEGGITEAEKRNMRDLGYQCGAVTVCLVEHTKKLTKDQALKSFKNCNY